VTQLVCIYDLDVKQMREISRSVIVKPHVAKTFSEIIECEDVDLVIEAASQEAEAICCKNIRGR